MNVMDCNECYIWPCPCDNCQYADNCEHTCPARPALDQCRLEIEADIQQYEDEELRFKEGEL